MKNIIIIFTLLLLSVPFGCGKVVDLVDQHDCIISVSKPHVSLTVANPMYMYKISSTTPCSIMAIFEVAETKFYPMAGKEEVQVYSVQKCIRFSGEVREVEVEVCSIVNTVVKFIGFMPITEL